MVPGNLFCPSQFLGFDNPQTEDPEHSIQNGRKKSQLGLKKVLL